MGSVDSGKRWVCADRVGGRDAARGAFRHGGGGERAACHCGPGRAARLCAVAAAAGVAVGGSSHALRRGGAGKPARSEEHTSELQSLMRISYAVFCLKKKNKNKKKQDSE